MRGLAVLLLKRDGPLWVGGCVRNAHIVGRILATWHGARPPHPLLCPSPLPLPSSAAYDLSNGGLPVYNTYLVGRSLVDGSPVWALNVSSCGYSKRPASPPVVQVGVLSAVTEEELLVMDAGSGQLRFDMRAGGRAGGWGGRGACAVVCASVACMVPTSRVFVVSTVGTGLDGVTCWLAGSWRWMGMGPSDRRMPAPALWFLIAKGSPGPPPCPPPPGPPHPSLLPLLCLCAAPYQPQASGGQNSYLPTTTFANCQGQLALVRCLGADAPGSLCAYNGYDVPITGRALDACSSSALPQQARGAAGLLAAAAAAAAWLLLT